jgi:two-component sensor histidine kinase
MEQTSSGTLRWQRGLLSLCAIGFIFWAFNIFQVYMWAGVGGIYITTTAVPFHDLVTIVVPGGPSAKAGIRADDVADLRTASTTDRWRFRYTWLANRSYTYALLRGATHQRITVRPKHWPVNLSSWSWYVGALGAVIFATIIAWRRPWLVEARVLCILLIANVIATCLSSNNWVTPSGALDLGAVMAGQAIADLAVLVLVAYTLLFGRPLSTLRKAIAAFAFLVLGFDLLYNLAAYAGTWSGAFDLVSGPIGTSALLSVWEPLALYSLPLLAIATAVAAARGRERSLLVLTTATLFLVYLMNVVAVIAGNIPALASNLTLTRVLRYVINGAEFLTPFAIGYALLSPRLLNIGFVLNRAAAELRTRLAQAQLENLRLQLHPHFLFNTLNAISAVMYEDVAKADAMITQLSDFLRLVLDSSGVQEVPLQRELTVERMYVGIMKTRLESRLNLSFDVDPALRDAAVPFMLLQPLLENSIKHGLAPDCNALDIAITARRDGTATVIAIHDNGVGLRGNGTAERHGLANVRSRLTHMYGDAAAFAIAPASDGGTEATLRIPFASIATAPS